MFHLKSHGLIDPASCTLNETMLQYMFHSQRIEIWEFLSLDLQNRILWTSDSYNYISFFIFINFNLISLILINFIPTPTKLCSQFWTTHVLIILEVVNILRKFQNLFHPRWLKYTLLSFHRNILWHFDIMHSIWVYIHFKFKFFLILRK